MRVGLRGRRTRTPSRVVPDSAAIRRTSRVTSRVSDALAEAAHRRAGAQGAMPRRSASAAYVVARAPAASAVTSRVSLIAARGK